MNRIDELEKVFSEHGLYADVVPTDGVVEVYIEWGDWKHDHLRADWLATENGWTKIDERITEDDGSDVYSSVHTYCFA